MKTYARKLLAVILSVVMTISALSVAFVGFTLTASAKNLSDMKSRSADIDSGETKFVVPEQIYLVPDGMSWKYPTSSPYQFYVNNDDNGNAIAKSAEETGKIYATFPASSGTLSVKAVSSVTSTTNLGGSTKINNSSKSNGSTWTVSNGTIDIDGGMSYAVPATTDGYYLLWTLTYTDRNDSKTKVLTNMTYVYKPYTVPVAAATSVGAGYWDFNYSGQFTWISGMHSIEKVRGDSSDWKGADYSGPSMYTGDEGSLAGFISEKNTGRYTKNTGTAENPVYSTYETSGSTARSNYSGTKRYAVFASSYSQSRPNLYTNYDNHEMDDFKNRQNGASSTNKYNVDNLTIYFKNKNKKVGEPGSHNWWLGAWTTANDGGKITIDASRYTNLNQIPNLALGMVMTSDQSCDQGKYKWFLSDREASSATDFRHGESDYWGDENTGNDYDFINSYTNKFVHDPVNTGKNDGGSFVSNAEGLAYAGPWIRSIGTINRGTRPEDIQAYNAKCDDDGNYKVEKNYHVYGLFSSAETSTKNTYHAMAFTEINLKTEQKDKLRLRTAVNNANKQFARFGVTGFSGGKLTSCYFDDSADARYKWTAFSNAYLNAIQELANLFGGANANAYATALTNALTALQTYYKFENGVHGTVSADRLTFTTIGANNTKTITLTSAPNVTPDTGYKFEGKWSTNKDAKYTDDSLGTTVKIGYNNSIYPIFTPKEYTITLNPAPGTLQGPNQFKATFDAKPDNVSVPTRTGYTFTGWYGTVNNVQVKFFDNKGVWANPEGNKVWKYATGEPALLRAGWEAVDVTLRFHTSETQVENVTTKVDANGNTVPLKFDDTYDIHQFTTTPSKTPVSEHHYIFTGKWYTDSGLTKEFDGNLNNAVIDLYPGFLTGLHNEQEVVITQPRKCYDTGTEDHYCSICHFKVREGVVIDAIGHHDLQTREEARAAGSFQDATCYQEGWVTVHCKYCYDASTDPRANYPAYHCNYDDTIDKEVKKAHTWAPDGHRGIYKQFSCTGNTIWYAKCINPGCTDESGFWEEPGTKLTHNPKNTDWVIVPGHEATCEQTGLRYKVCQNVDGNGNFCGAHLDSTNRVTEGEVYGPLGHKWQDSDLTDPVALEHCQKVPTCHTVGVYYRYCPQCGKYADDESFNGRYNAQIFSGTELDYDNHNGDTRRENYVRATCVSTGKYGRTYCYGCNSFYGELGGTETDHILDIDPNAHVHGTHGDDYIAPMCDTLGYSGNQRCNDCNAVLQTCVELPMDPNNHNPERLEYNHNHVFATCEEYGTAGTTYCTHCQVDVAMGNRIKPIGHHGGTYIVGAIRATCVQDGYSGDVYCNTCKKLIKYGEMLSMDKANHTDNNGDGVCDLCGVKYKDGDERWDPDTDINPTPDDDYGDCSCDCHKNLRGIRKFFWNIKVFFWKVFKMNKFCKCGREHYLS